VRTSPPQKCASGGAPRAAKVSAAWTSEMEINKSAAAAPRSPRTRQRWNLGPDALPKNADCLASGANTRKIKKQQSVFSFLWDGPVLWNAGTVWMVGLSYSVLSILFFFYD